MAEIHPDILAFWQDEPQKLGTPEELRQLEADLGTTLPDSFKEYQSEIGYKRIYFKNEKYKWGKWRLESMQYMTWALKKESVISYLPIFTQSTE
ncbi:hypothetical protein P6U16_25365 (plasmid) [Rhizobium sp. 32-5/1]|uniref:hypothetical protein n=1 Tax=Rhizobium sp. 32-5/1 TaxID=3019602 RepID=UPI00240E4DD4|nr:hypothetical protein [Rhizobium sp. 32-5/1]WEZ85428.1 hypothetical protein P6U16_25365 [Rhizobium sp. 32-5/1]